MDLELNGKVAIVTGGSKGIGKAIARVLGQEGASVAIAARTKETLDATAAELAAETGAKYLPVVVDTGDDASVRAMVDAVVAEFGRVDILVNSAAKPGGQGPVPRLAEITTELFWDEMNTKVMGYLRCAREVAPYMQRQGWGRIINLSGHAARRTGTIVGGIRNIGVVALSKNLADELGPSGINVVTVHPGLTRTEATPRVIADRAAALGISEAEVEREMASRNSIRTFVDATDVANVVVFLTSPKAMAVTGDTVAAGGGATNAIFQ